MELANGWRTLASGRTVFFENGKVAKDEQEEFDYVETCGICDGIHSGVCPLEDDGRYYGPEEL